MPTQYGRARNISSLVNSNQGGGDKKAGLYSSVGKDSWTSVAYGSTPTRCMTLTCMQTLRGPLACASRPVGSISVNPHFNC